MYIMFLVLSCPAGTYIDNFSCKQCSEGTYSTSENQFSCTNCPVGTYTNTTGQTSCFNCPDGTYNPNTNSTSSSSCIKCDIGQRNNSDHSACESCPAGSYKGINDPTCLFCPPGTYNSNTGSTSILDCLKCAPGQITNIGSTNIEQCESCPPGTYEYNRACISCPTGTYNSTAGSTKCTPCPNNGLSDEGSTDISFCNNCGYGFYKSNTGGCIKCSSGTYKPTVLGTDPSLCLPCPTGFNSSSGASSCYYTDTASLDDPLYSASYVYKIVVDSNTNICVSGGSIPFGNGGQNIVLTWS